MRRFLLWTFLLVFVGLPLGAAALVWAMLEDAPVVVRKAALTPDEIERARRIAGLHDPRRKSTKVERTLTVTAGDLDTAMNYVVARYARGSAKVALQAGTASLWGSVPVPGSASRWLNVEATIRETGDLPRLENVRLGRVPVPDILSAWIERRVVEHFNGTESGEVAADVIRGVSIAPGALTVVYHWRDDTVQRLGRLLVSPEEEARLRSHQERLQQLTSGAELAQQVSLTQLLVPLTRHAAQRVRAGSDAVAENRAMLLVLAFYVNGKGLGAIVPAARAWPRPVARRVTLSGRDDFPLHFMISAVLAAGAGGPLADAVGVYKEVDDSRRGSGFSFTDIAADRAGTLFGERATRSAQSARALQARVVEGLVEADIIPRATDLPEMMPEAEFLRRFGGLQGAAYRDMMREIERRLAALALYR